MTNPPPRKRPVSGPMADRAFGWLAKGAAIFTLAILLAILGSLTMSAWPAISKYGFSFLTSTNWDPVKEDFGGLVMIYGTLMTSLIALVIAVPVSFGIAVFLTELSPAWLKRPLGTAVELLAAIPSIVYGMWGLLVFGPLLATYVQQPLQAMFGGVPYLGALVSGPPVGIGILSAGIILAIMIIPFIAAVMRDVFEVTPTLLKESAYGLGATTWEVVSKVVLPYTKAGVIGGIMLGLGEQRDEILRAMDDLLEADVTVLTMGQYLRPTPRHLPVVEYVEPAVFDELKQIALEKGFRHVASGPLVRSSYHAADFRPELDIMDEIDKAVPVRGLDLQPEDLPIPAATPALVRASVA